MDIDLVVTPGLGDNSYVVSAGGRALVVDAQRDVKRLVEAARARGAEIEAAVETHVHNDYVSGASELRAATGAEIVGPAGAEYAFPHRGMRDEAEIEIGDHRLVAVSTPGHTPEHLSYVLRSPEGQAIAVFTGGSLLVGNAGRTDLLGPERTDELTRAQFRSMHRLAELPDDVLVLPTHGSGSFCASEVPSPTRTSSIGSERRTNPALSGLDEERFVAEQLAGLPAYPTYYARMAPINRAGPRVLGSVPLPPPVSPEDVERLLERGGWLVDAREGPSFATSHVPGSLNVPLEESFASYVGWLVPFGAEVALVVEGEDALAEASTQLFRIGYEPLVGYLRGGVGAWASSGRPVASYPAVTSEDLAGELAREPVRDVLDVRQRTEWDAGHLDGSRHVFVGDVASTVETLPRDRITTVVCASGYRSAMAASLLDRAGVPVRLVARGGVPRILRTLRRRAD